MNGYSSSKLRFLSKKSRSIDFSDLLISTNDTSPSDQTKQKQNLQNSPPPTIHGGRKSAVNHEELVMDTIHEHGHHDQYQSGIARRMSADMGVGAMNLTKNSSVSATTMAKGGGIKSAVKRAFSMRRSSSTSSESHEKYCRIHDQCVAILLEGPFDDDDDDETKEEDNVVGIQKTMGSMENGKFTSRGKIFRACKRLLGFK